MLGGAGANAPTMPIIVPLTPASIHGSRGPEIERRMSEAVL
jgi:hypothetical protein